MNEKHLLKNAHTTFDSLKKRSKGKKKISFATEIENNCIRRKSFISMLNARFVWEHFIHIVTKES